MSSIQFKRTAHNYSLKKIEVIHSDRFLLDDSLLSTEGTVDSGCSRNPQGGKARETVSVGARTEEDKWAKGDKQVSKPPGKKSVSLGQFSPIMQQLQRKEESTNLMMLFFKRLKSCFGNSN